MIVSVYLTETLDTFLTFGHLKVNFHGTYFIETFLPLMI